MGLSFPQIDVVPVRTPTLPPATHTNTWILGDAHLSIVDPASPWEDEQARLFADLSARVEAGATIERIVLTHHHHDHVSGAVDLQRRFAQRGCVLPIATHAATAALLSFEIQETIVDRQVLRCDGLQLVAHHTPGHAPGHLVFHDPDSGAVVAGDLVAGIGTIAIDPREGDLQDYLDSLEHVRGLSPTALLPAHGPILEHPDTVLSFYVAHRNSRSQQILEALDPLGLATPMQLAPLVYPQLPEAHHPLAAAQILTHLHWLRNASLATEPEPGRWRAHS